MRHLLKVTDEERQRRREQILGTSLKDFRCVLAFLLSMHGIIKTVDLQKSFACYVASLNT